MAQLNLISSLHNKTRRDYRQRVLEHDKGESAEIAKKWGFDYWDGDRRYGYGGYRYDGRWRPIAEALARHYGLKSGNRVLDVGCGKAFLLYELTQVVPDLEIAGVDVSAYGIEHAKEEVKASLQIGNACELPWPNNHFDFVYSINTLHNLPNYDLDRALREMQRVGRSKRFICVESYRNEHEKANLLYWQLTCATFHTPAEWRWACDQAGYQGDLDFIFFE